MADTAALRFPECLIVKVVEQGTDRPIAGIAVGLTLHAARKNDYNLLPGLTDSAGLVRISRAWVEKAIAEIAGFFVMDYSSRIEECSSTATIEVLSEHDLSAVVAARQLYAEAPPMGIAPSAGQLITAENRDYEPRVVTVTLDRPDRVRLVVVALKPRVQVE